MSLVCMWGFALSVARQIRKRISGRGVFYALILWISGYLAFYTEWRDNTLALIGLMLFVAFMYGFLWPEKSVPADSGGWQGGVHQVIPKGGLRWVTQAAVDQAVRQRIAAQPGTDTAAEQCASERTRDT